MTIQIPPPELQIEFAFELKRFRGLYLQSALRQTVEQISISALDKELAEFVGDEDLAKLASFGLRAEILFAVPMLLRRSPFLLGYYRLLLGFSQKEFYGSDAGFGIGFLKPMETRGQLSAKAESALGDLCSQLCSSASALIAGLDSVELSAKFANELTLLTVGPQLRGGANNRRGAQGIVQVFEIIKDIVGHAAIGIREGAIEIRSATGRIFSIEFAPDPDIVIKEEMVANEVRNVVAVEVKAGTDTSNIHNRIGEAEKSHQKARKAGFTECWTVVNVENLDMHQAASESPSTDRFYYLGALTDPESAIFQDFKRRVLSLTAIAPSK